MSAELSWVSNSKGLLSLEWGFLNFYFIFIRSVCIL